MSTFATVQWIEWNTEKMVFPHAIMGITTKSKSISEHTVEVISLGILAHKNGKLGCLEGNVVM